SIERCICNLVGLIQNVDLVLIPRRPVACRIPQLANLVDPAIGCSVDFDYIHGVSCANLRAAIAYLARFSSRTLCRSDRIPAIQRHREYPRNRRLPDASVAAEDVPMCNAALGQRI